MDILFIIGVKILMLVKLVRYFEITHFLGIK